MPEIDAELGEVLQDNEEGLTEQIGAVLSEDVRRKFKSHGSPAMRDQHPRAHGCVQAEFRIEDRLPPQLAQVLVPGSQGVFVPGMSYPAWIRFSNGKSDPTQHDAEGDVRGMAIKLLNVPGDKILDEERDAQTQDFIMINHPVFLVDDPARYLALIHAAATSKPVLKKLKVILAIGLEGAKIAKAMTSSKIASPLEARYWSTVPFRLGDPPRKQAIKFSARPSLPPVAATIPPNPTPRFLRETMIRQLEAGEARFDFLVQPRASPAMEVENSRAEWRSRMRPSSKWPRSRSRGSSSRPPSAMSSARTCRSRPGTLCRSIALWARSIASAGWSIRPSPSCATT